MFVVAPDDILIIRGKRQASVRDNVLFEIGVFMGVLGPKRTFVLWPKKTAVTQRLPSDLQGLVTIPYAGVRELRAHLVKLRKAIVSMGRTLRSGYNELASLSQVLEEQELLVKRDAWVSIKDIVAPIAGGRLRPWYVRTPVRRLMMAVEKRYKHDTVNELFWWLVVDGIITFDNIEQWTSDEDFDYSASLEYAVFTDRGAALLNYLRDDDSGQRTRRKRSNATERGSMSR